MIRMLLTSSPLASFTELPTLACRPTLKKEMEFCEQSPGEVEKVAGLRQQVAEVKNVMLSNIDAVRCASYHDSYMRKSCSGRRAQNKCAEIGALLWLNLGRVIGFELIVIVKVMK